eukprot:1379844-Rhodomonas_salina.2
MARLMNLEPHEEEQGQTRRKLLLVGDAAATLALPKITTSRFAFIQFACTSVPRHYYRFWALHTKQCRKGCGFCTNLSQWLFVLYGYGPTVVISVPR